MLLFPAVTRPKLRNQKSLSTISMAQSPEINQFADLADIQKTFLSPRHYLRRKALIESDLQEDVSSSKLLKSHSTVSRLNNEKLGQLGLTLTQLWELHDDKV